MLNKRYDFIVCGAGSSGSVVARRLAEHPEVSVLLIEAGGSDELPSVTEPGLWPTNLGTERDWSFMSFPERQLNGRSIPLSMGKVLGGGSSINVLIWSRGHATDWDYFAATTEDSRWSHASVTDLYRTKIEDWHGPASTANRGTGGLVFVQPPPNPNPIATAMLDAAAGLGIPTFGSHNEALTERRGGAGLMDMIMKDGKRQSIFRAYAVPIMGQPNLTVLSQALVTRLLIQDGGVTGVEILHQGELIDVDAGCEVILSLGALNTPKLLMQSGIGDRDHLKAFNIDAIQHSPGVGQNFQDHIQCSCTWEYKEPLLPRNNGGEAALYWQSDPALEGPDLILSQAEMPLASPENTALGLPEHGWSLFCGVARPQSRGKVSLTGPNYDDRLQIETGALTHPEDVKMLRASLALGREIGNSPAFQSYNKREVMPGLLEEPALLNYLRNGAATFWHQSGTAKMGKDAMSVVDGKLAVYGVKRLRIADSSVMPRIMTGNTMAPCVVIGELAAASILSDYRI